MVLIYLNFQDLLDGLDLLDSWPNKVKAMQKIGLENLLVVKSILKLKEIYLSKKLNAIQQDLIHFLVSFWLYQMIMRFQNFIKMIKISSNLKNAQKQDNGRSYSGREKIEFKN